MKKIGLITYHNAYNFGSVLQTFATQKIIKDLGHECIVLNYITQSQKKFYSLYKFTSIKELIIDFFKLPFHVLRTISINRFESFIKEKFTLTEEVNEPELIVNQFNNFDVLVSGSDQILNKHSCELNDVDWKYMNPYLLKGFKGKKVSYASSLANMTDEEINLIKNDLQLFDSFSLREQSDLSRVEIILQKAVETVCDPTFLLSKQQWEQALELNEGNNDYILFYSLNKSFINTPRVKKIIKNLSKRTGLKVKLVTPFQYFYFCDNKMITCYEYGPIEFMSALKNARYVITDSYHGTILSINFNKDFYSLCKNSGSEHRKTDVMNRLGVANRIIQDFEELNDLELSSIDYENINQKIEEFRNNSLRYLKESLM